MRTHERLSRRVIVPLGSALLLAVAVLLALGPRSSQAVPIGSRIPWQGQNWYLEGANLPWYNWSCDFGCASSGGVSSGAVSASLATTFAQAHAAGLHVIRWWMFEGSAWQITKDSSGAPSGLDPRVYTDIDAALALAQTYDLYYDFALFSAPTAIPSTWLTDSTQQAKLAGGIGQLAAHYSGNPHILSWEAFNEPEWDIWNGKIAAAPVQATVKAIAAAVHANSTAYVTVGSAELDGLPLWKGLGLDYYQAHWYDYMNAGNYDAMLWTYAQVQQRYTLDAPLVMGEFYAGATASPSALTRDEYWYTSGYAGSWAWSLEPSHTSDAMSIDLTAATTVAAQYSDFGPVAGSGATSATPTPTTTTMTATPTTTVTPMPTSTTIPTTTPTPTPTTTSAPATAGPMIAAISPTGGATKGGTVVTISGSGFSTVARATTVTFGTKTATKVSCSSTTNCTATSPRAVVGTVDVRVTVGGKTSPIVTADRFTYTR